VKTDFKANLRSELDYLGLTVKELSAKTGIAKGTLDCYLGARASMPPADVAVKIANVLGVSVEYLVTGKEIPNKDAFPLTRHNVRSLIQIILESSEKEVEILTEIAKVLKKQADKK
jgi:transcriptional regulator with XRE-family HTH domain